MQRSILLTPLILLACSPDKAGPTGEDTPASSDSAPVGDPDSASGGDSAPTDTPDPCADAVWPDLRINELVAANLESLTDAAGDTPDWFELVNRSDGPVALDGWTLANEDDDAWAPAGLTLEKDELLLVLASGEAQAGDPHAGEEVHAGFKLSASDAALRLVAPDGCVVHEAAPERLYGDVSYGLTGDSVFEYYMEPTPGAENLTESRPGFAAVPSLSPAPGFYEDAVTVTLSSTEAGATLRYTLDGSAPDEDATAYTAPFTVEGSDQPAVVVARAWVDGLWPSRIAAATYSEDAEIPAAGLYVVSIIADPDDLFSDERGIYAFGLDDYEHSYPYFGANFWEEWERPARIQIWDPAGVRVIDQDAGLSIHGGYTRAFDQKSLRLSARSAYGPDTFDHAFFGDAGLQEPSTLVLQIGMDWCSTHLQEVTLAELLRDPSTGELVEGADITGWAPAQVWLNGAYWGYYNLRERADSEWIEGYHGADPDALDRVELGWTSSPHWELEQGSWDNLNALNAFVSTADMSDEATWEAFDAMVDLDSLATAVIGEAWIGNSDWWYNNLRLWRPTDPDGQWRWILYDLGHGWPRVDENQISYSVTWTGDGLPIEAALRNDAFRTLLANHASDLLNTRLEGDAAMARFDAMSTAIEPAMAGQFDRWCSGGTTAWRGAITTARTFVRLREDILRAQVRSALSLPGTATLALSASPAGAGRFQLTAVSVDAPFTGIFYQGVPVSVTALPADGYRFTGWSDTSLGDEPSVALTLTGDGALTAVFEAD